MMAKKLTLTLMMGILCAHQVFAGSGNSTPLAEERDDRSERTRKTRHTNTVEADIAAGAAVLTTVAVAGFVLYNALKETDSEGDSSSHDFDSVAMGTAMGTNQTYTRDRSEKHSSFDLSDSHSDEASEPEEKGPITSLKNCPAIDLGYYFNDSVTHEGRIPEIDLHPVYNKNFRKHLRDEVFQRQRAYHLSETKEKKVYIITGTGKGRPGPNFTLQHAVSELLNEDYFYRRIAHRRLEKEGLFVIFLRKNIKPSAEDKRS